MEERRRSKAYRNEFHPDGKTPGPGRHAGSQHRHRRCISQRSGLLCKEVLSIGAVYESKLRIWTHEVLHAFLQIVRIEMKGDSYTYGAVFIGMSESDAARIRVYQTINDDEKQ